jgi:hypothetical protein
MKKLSPKGLQKYQLSIMNDGDNIKKREEAIYPNRYSFLDKKNKLEINSKIQKNRKKHTAEAIIIIIAFIIGLIILEIFIFSSFDSTANKSRDVAIKSNLRLIASEAYDYASRNNGSFRGFTPKSDANTASWSGNPIFNASEDGQRAAIFMKSAEKSSTYFCADPATVDPDDLNKVNIYEVSEKYAKGGNALCVP